MHDFSPGWLLTTEQVPHWMIVRMTRYGDDPAPEPPVADAVMALADEQNQHRVIFEQNGELLLASRLVGQLVELQKRLHLKSGALRMCGWSEYNVEVIRLMRLMDRLPNYPTREAAVAGTLPE